MKKLLAAAVTFVASALMTGVASAGPVMGC